MICLEYYNRIYKPIATRGQGADNEEDVRIGENPNLDAWTFSNIK